MWFGLEQLVNLLAMKGEADGGVHGIQIVRPG